MRILKYRKRQRRSQTIKGGDTLSNIMASMTRKRIPPCVIYEEINLLASVTKGQVAYHSRKYGGGCRNNAREYARKMFRKKIAQAA